MSKPLYREIFGSFPEESAAELINTCTVEKCSLDIQTRSIDVTFSSKQYVSLAIRREVNSCIKSAVRKMLHWSYPMLTNSLLML